MFVAEYKGVNSFLVGASKLLLEYAVRRETRGYTCWELPEPFYFKIIDPTARWITIPERKWNLTLPYAESLWLASGRNDLDFVKQYVKKLAEFSDDGRFIRGGYGPRFRFFRGTITDYKNKLPLKNFDILDKVAQVDQFSFIEECFKLERNTRRAIMNVGDPPKDSFDADGKLKETKDFPCTRLLHFMKDSSEEKLNLTVYMRSNDFLWGASAVNIFNNTLIQEYFAQILDLEIGVYYHFANNFHYYEDQKSMIETLANVNEISDEGFKYAKTFKSLKEFDTRIIQLNEMVEELRTGTKKDRLDLEDDFFSDWFKVFHKFHTKSEVEFINPILNQLTNSKQI
ncbi:MAG: thymidylate synthase [Ignavibacteria bacterium]|jgi:thymidylate synthase